MVDETVLKRAPKLSMKLSLLQVSRLASETSAATELPGYKKSHEKWCQFLYVAKNGCKRTIKKASFEKEVYVFYLSVSSVLKPEILGMLKHTPYPPLR